MNRLLFILTVFILLIISQLNGIDDKFIRLVYESKIPVAYNIKTDERHIYIFNDWYLYIYSYVNIWNPAIETAFQTTFPMTDVLNLGSNQIFICSPEPTIEITELDSLNKFGRIYFARRLLCNKAKREGALLYTSHAENGIEMFELGKGITPLKISSFSEKWGIIDFDAKYPYLHALNDFGYVNIGIEDLTNPKANGTNYDIVEGTVLCLNRNIVWVGARSTLLAVDITYPDNPVIINRYRFAYDINAIKAKGNELYVALKTSGLKILNISNPKKITEKNSFYLRTGINALALEDDYIFIAAGVQGWFILEYR